MEFIETWEAGRMLMAAAVLDIDEKGGELVSGYFFHLEQLGMYDELELFEMIKFLEEGAMKMKTEAWSPITRVLRNQKCLIAKFQRNI